MAAVSKVTCKFSISLRLLLIVNTFSKYKRISSKMEDKRAAGIGFSCTTQWRPELVCTLLLYNNTPYHTKVTNITQGICQSVHEASC